ncbi:uncharacterized protein ARMOST_03807 [Armillaria ostoyae]|uniref:Uncharacterized protein n=1 Tax=Armillaria ostoyae TaxID=47428 RepID=A0A284QVJ9_ARMOS|nr:uncharacterized protein ARMOST_03807 [Armillaria ostoyae]
MEPCGPRLVTSSLRTWLRYFTFAKRLVSAVPILAEPAKLFD